MRSTEMERETEREKKDGRKRRHIWVQWIEKENQKNIVGDRN